MTTKKISQLPPASAVSGTDLWEIAQASASKSATLVNMFNYGIPAFNIEQKSNKNVLNGYPGLDGSGKIISGVLPNDITANNFFCTGNLHFTPTSPNTSIDINSCEYYDFSFEWLIGGGPFASCVAKLIKFGPFCNVKFSSFSGVTHDAPYIISDNPIPSFFRPPNDTYLISSYLLNSSLEIFSYLILQQDGYIKIRRFPGDNFNDGSDLAVRTDSFFYNGTI